jgi:hypothetical protein
MPGWNSERLLGWAASLAVAAFLLIAASTLAPSLVPRVLASPLSHVSGLACFGLCVAAVVAEPQRRP